MDADGKDAYRVQQLDVVTGGHKYQLIGGPLTATTMRTHYGLLPVGDYKAKLVKKDYKPDYLLFLTTVRLEVK